MSYKIEITEIKDVVVTETGSYAVVGKQYLSASDYAKLSSEEKREWRAIDGQYELLVYGYPPAKTFAKTVSTKIYEQTVLSVDIATITQVVNQGPVQVPVGLKGVAITEADKVARERKLSDLDSYCPSAM